MPEASSRWSARPPSLLLAFHALVVAIVSRILQPVLSSVDLLAALAETFVDAVASMLPFPVEADHDDLADLLVDQLRKASIGLLRRRPSGLVPR